ncbi:MAG: endolytic transglycosylase MltG [Candidatus Komeilibacteria bacterium]
MIEVYQKYSLKRRFIFSIIIIILVIGAIFYLSGDAIDDNVIIVTIPAQASLPEVTDLLVGENIISHPVLFGWYLRISGQAEQIKAGQHKLSAAMSWSEMVHELTITTSAKEKQITIIEGWTNNQIGQYLVNSNLVNYDEWQQAMAAAYDYNWLPKRTDDYLQGYLFPDTYRVYFDSSAEQIVNKLLANFANKVDTDLQAEIEARGYSLRQVITLASIVEREVRADQDRALVADIFWRRLADNYPLQSDATVTYITQKKHPQATFADTKIDSPYNTYKYAGLPPGPISNPSLSAIKAVIYPQANDYYFFLTTNDDGRVIYSRTYEEHLRNKAKYLD